MIAQSPTIKAWHPLDTAPAPEPTEAQQQRRKRYALVLCLNAQNAASWRLADRLALAWDCGGCAALGVLVPER